MSERSTDNQSVAEILRELQSEFTNLKEQNTDIQSQNAGLRQKNEALEQRIRTLEVRLATTEDTVIDLSPNNLGKQTHKAFALFPKLPPELRQMVWTFARPAPRVVNIFLSKTDGNDILYSTAKVPSLLHVCQESRRLAKQWYQLSFQLAINWGDPDAARVYFDFSSDFLYFPYLTGGDPSDHSRFFPHAWDIDCDTRAKVRKVVQEVTSYSEQFYRISISYPFATEALLVGRKEGMSQGGAEQSDFVVTEDAFGWQKYRSLVDIYNTHVENPDDFDKTLPWNLVSIQRARFHGVEKEN